jgi:replicative DNA helicase
LAQALEKPLPHDDLMERAVLGAILAGHEQTTELLAVIKPEDFFDQRHRRIVRAVLDLSEAGNRPELLAVYDALITSEGIESVGGTGYLSGLVDGVALRGDTLYILRGLRRMASFRQTIYAAENVKQLAMEQVGSAESLLDAAVEKFSMLARELESTEDDGKAYFDAAIEALSIARQGARLKIFTDINKLDQWTGGFREVSLSCSRQKLGRESHSSPPRSGHGLAVMAIMLSFAAEK